MDSANAEALESSLLPFRFCERHHLPRSYERSLRLEGGRLWANRFVLGVPAQSLTQAMFGDLLQTLNFPDPRLVPQLGLHWRRASTLYLGFAEAAQGHSRRLYFEYWQEVEHRLHTARSQARATPLSLPRGTGFKWCPQQPGSLHRTDYSHQAGLSRADLLQRCRRALLLGDPQAAPRHDNDNDNSNSNEKHKDNENENQNENENENENDKNLPRPKDTLAPADHHHLFRPLLTLIEGILQSAPAIQPVFLEAREPGSCRSSCLLYTSSSPRD